MTLEQTWAKLRRLSRHEQNCDARAGLGKTAQLFPNDFNVVLSSHVLQLFHQRRMYDAARSETLAAVGEVQY